MGESPRMQPDRSWPKNSNQVTSSRKLNVLRWKIVILHLAQFCVVLAQYVGALLAATVASLLFFGISALVLTAANDAIPGLHKSATLITATITTLTGAVGVLAAGALAPKTSRHITTWLFTILGCAFYLHYWIVIGSNHREGSQPPWMLPWLFLGGCIVSVIITIRWRQGRHFQPPPMNGADVV